MPKTVIHYIIYLILKIISIVLVPLKASANNEMPSFVFLETNSNSQMQKEEQIFYKTLSLQIDRFKIIKKKTKNNHFIDLPSQLQVDQLYDILKSSKSSAALWLSQGISGVITLHILTLEKNQAVFRLFRQQQDFETSRELARTAADLLETTYLFDIKKNIPEKSIPEDINTVDIPVYNDEIFKDSINISPMITAQISGPITGHHNPFFSISGGGGLYITSTNSIGVKGQISGTYSPLFRKKNSDPQVNKFGLAGDIDLWFNLMERSISIGPLFGLSGGFESIRILRSETKKFYNYGILVIRLGLHLTPSAFTKNTTLSAGLSAHPYKTEVLKESSSETIFRNHNIGWFFSMERMFF